MAEGKKSVLLYCDLIHTIEKMDNETAGEFFKHYLRYINDKNPETNNPLVDITFESVKQNLKRDLKKWEVRAEKSRQNGKLGGRPKQEETQETQQVILKPRKPVTDTVTVNVTDTVKDINKSDSKESFFNTFWTKYPNKVAKDKCKSKFIKLSQKEIDTILETIDIFISNKPFKEYTHPNPMTYLNQKRWEDEVNTSAKTGSETSNDKGYYKHLDTLAEKAKQQIEFYERTENGK